ncbi:MAG: hypothetical protein HC802_23170 [Caldilineaceae bacterium]|nr:hypothetical protein [Caldilineaceae bacterium]
MVALFIFVGCAGWRIGDMLSPDALSMAVGMFFGVMAGIPTALLVMAGSRRSREEEDDDPRRFRQPAPYAAQPPVVVLTSGSAYPQQPSGPGSGYGRGDPNEWEWAKSARQFKIVGEQEAWLEE